VQEVLSPEITKREEQLGASLNEEEGKEESQVTLGSDSLSYDKLSRANLGSGRKRVFCIFKSSKQVRLEPWGRGRHHESLACGV
jgi:hypothetical protein